MKPAKEADCHVKVLRTSEIDDILFPSHESVELDEFNFIDDNDELTKKGFQFFATKPVLINHLLC